MRGEDQQQTELFSYGSLEQRVPADHPLRAIRSMVDEALKALDSKFNKIYDPDGRPSIAPERLLRALLVQMLYTVRSERMLMEQLEYNLLFRWFVGLGMSRPWSFGPQRRMKIVSVCGSVDESLGERGRFTLARL